MRLTIFIGRGAVVLCSLLVCASPVYAFDWADLWSSAEQRAESQLENQQYDELIDNPPDANWRGLGQYRKGDYAAAAKSFAEQREVAEQAGLTDDALQAMYNQANAHVREENYPQALNLFDEILASNPQHDNARHNRDITQQLLEQEQQQQQQQDSGEQGEQGDESEQSDDQQQNSESSDGQESDEQDSDQNSSEQQQNDQASEDQQAGSNADNAAAEDEAASAQAEQEAAAAAAMQAEQQRQAEQAQTEEATVSEGDAPVAPLTEREQANEQWLRQIPDDPAGLLQRKLQNRHLTDFPKVKDSNEPW